jgi:flagellar hook-associated protein 1 FlgK
MSGFSTLNTAVSGLQAAQRAMDVAGQNVVNANTTGYSRQRVDLATSGTTSSATFHTGNAPILSGVSIEAITRIRDSFLEAMRSAAGAKQASLTAEATTLSSAQQLLSEPTATGLQNTLDEFYSSWYDLSLTSTDDAAGAVVLQRANAVVDQLHSLTSNLSDQWSTTHTALDNVVAEANQATEDLAALNGQIQAGTVSGSTVNDLLDRRDLLVRQLAELVGATAVVGEDNQVNVSVGGVNVVSGTTSQELALDGAVTIGTATSDPPTLMWGTTTVSVDSGSAAGYLAALRTDLPEMQEQLDGVAVALVDAVNSVHQTGYTRAGVTGTDFFSGTGADDIAIVPTDPAELAVAASAGVVDGSIAAAIGDLAEDDASSAALGGGRGASELWRELTTTLGVRVQSLESSVTVQDSVVAAAQDAVESSAGVSLDEEMTNMLLYQRAYQASARVVTVVDEMMNTLINRMAAG